MWGLFSSSPVPPALFEQENQNLLPQMPASLTSRNAAPDSCRETKPPSHMADGSHVPWSHQQARFQSSTLIEYDHGSAARLGGSPWRALRQYLLMEDQRWCPQSAEVRGTGTSLLPLVVVPFHEVWGPCPTCQCSTRSQSELIFQVRFHEAVSSAFLKSKYITSTGFPSSANFVIPSKMQSSLSGKVYSLQIPWFNSPTSGGWRTESTFASLIKLIQTSVFNRLNWKFCKKRLALSICLTLWFLIGWKYWKKRLWHCISVLLHYLETGKSTKKCFF